VAHTLRVRDGSHALAERESVDGVEEIGLAHAVLADEAIHIAGEVEFGLSDILIM
jgi:hypothetical protein